MALWFRIYDDALDDPRLQRLPPATFRTWFNLLCVASKRGGALPPLGELAFMLRSRVAVLEYRIEALRAAGLIEETDGALRPVDWERRQTIRETSGDDALTGAERTRRWRERRDAAVTPQRDDEASRRDEPVTGDREQDQDQDQESGSAPAARESEGFAKFWAEFPKRADDNPEAPARAAFRKAVATGAELEAIIAGAKAYAATCAEREPRFIASAARWLCEERWRGSTSAPKPEAAVSPPGVWIGLDKPGWKEWAAWWRATNGRSPPTDAKGGWRFPSLNPPALEQAA